MFATRNTLPTRPHLVIGSDMYSAVPIVHHVAREEPPWWEDARVVLSQGQAPTVFEHYQGIPKDVRWNLSRVLTDCNVHDEGTMYGYYNRFLNAIFPSGRGFQVCRLGQFPYRGSQTDIYVSKTRLTRNTPCVPRPAI